MDTKYYLANGYVVDVVGGEIQPDDQHEELRVFQSAPDSLHKYLKAYIKTSATFTGWL